MHGRVSVDETIWVVYVQRGANGLPHMEPGNNNSDDLDTRAQHAARLVFDGAAADIDAALATLGEGVKPSRSRVRRHLQAMQQAASGLGQWWRDRLEALEAVVELVETVQYVAPQCTVLLTGRTAQGHVDSSAAASARVIGVTAPMLADALEQHGLRPPGVVSLSTSLGSMPLVQVVDRRGHAVDLLVLPDTPAAHEAVNLVDGARVSVLRLERFREIVVAARVESR